MLLKAAYMSAADSSDGCSAFVVNRFFSLSFDSDQLESLMSSNIASLSLRYPSVFHGLPLSSSATVSR